MNENRPSRAGVVRGALNNRYPSHDWNFEGHAGDRVIITMIDASGAGLLNPQLILRTLDGTEIVVSDDIGTIQVEGLSPRDARIDYTLAEDGLFIIAAGRFGGRGDYILTVELAQ
ncbi:MAG: hypothetical protein JXA10_06790 [Anaerolineae bacterium]|nr:hypothetical protein [Anaerolineae bacterium]